MGWEARSDALVEGSLMWVSTFRRSATTCAGGLGYDCLQQHNVLLQACTCDLHALSGSWATCIGWATLNVSIQQTFPQCVCPNLDTLPVAMRTGGYERVPHCNYPQLFPLLAGVPYFGLLRPLIRCKLMRDRVCVSLLHIFMFIA